jgi:Glycosyl transferase family 11
MVIVRLIGGLGNQMFQYSMGRALAIRKGTALLLDTTGFRNYSLHHGFELSSVFSIEPRIASPRDVRSVLGWRSVGRVRALLARRSLAAIRGKRLVVEPHLEYWPGITMVPDDCYLSGYWQSEKYFADASDIIRSDFKFRQSLNGLNLALSQEIGSCNSVSLHIRRGDYVSNPLTLATHGVCSIDYYARAVEYVARLYPNPFFFVFSDDPRWALENLKLDFPCRIVDHNQGAQSNIDMQLMSLCRHNITANSTFSWWAAWLNGNEGKIVVTPRSWFASTALRTSDLIPQTWIPL